jgi:hypothetical protein
MAAFVVWDGLSVCPGGGGGAEVFLWGVGLF